MKSQNVYAILLKKLSPIFKEMGFKRISGSRPKWYKDFVSSSLHFYFQTHKYPWEPYKGCEVALRSYSCPIGTPANEVESDFGRPRRLFERNSTPIKEVHRHNVSVIEKIQAIDLDEIIRDESNLFDDIEELRVLYESGAGLLERDKELDSTELFVDTEIRYLDEGDVYALASIYEKYLRQEIDRLVKEEEEIPNKAKQAGTR